MSDNVNTSFSIFVINTLTLSLIKYLIEDDKKGTIKNLLDTLNSYLKGDPKRKATIIYVLKDLEKNERLAIEFRKFFSIILENFEGTFLEQKQYISDIIRNNKEALDIYSKYKDKLTTNDIFRGVRKLGNFQDTHYENNNYEGNINEGENYNKNLDDDFFESLLFFIKKPPVGYSAIRDDKYHDYNREVEGFNKIQEIKELATIHDGWALNTLCNKIFKGRNIKNMDLSIIELFLDKFFKIPDNSSRITQFIPFNRLSEEEKDKDKPAREFIHKLNNAGEFDEFRKLIQSELNSIGNKYLTRGGRRTKKRYGKKRKGSRHRR